MPMGKSKKYERPHDCDICGGPGGRHDMEGGPFTAEGPAWVCQKCVKRIFRERRQYLSMSEEIFEDDGTHTSH
jgi:hypothetical protein